jgi:hypothetical protein
MSFTVMGSAPSTEQRSIIDRLAWLATAASLRNASSSHGSPGSPAATLLGCLSRQPIVNSSTSGTGERRFATYRWRSHQAFRTQTYISARLLHRSGCRWRIGFMPEGRLSRGATEFLAQNVEIHCHTLDLQQTLRQLLKQLQQLAAAISSCFLLSAARLRAGKERCCGGTTPKHSRRSPSRMI